MAEYTPEQVVEYINAYQDFAKTHEDIDHWKGQHSALKKRAVMRALAVKLPEYEEKIPQEIRDQLPLDKTTLAQKIIELGLE